MSGIPSWARKGVKVVCVKRFNKAKLAVGECAPEYGEVCTIRKAWIERGGAMVLLREYHNPSVWTEDGLRERPLLLSFVKPLVPTKTEAEDVAMFKRVAHTPNPALQRDFSPYPRERA